ncbi:MAG TPA: hypothetical protein VK756_05405 [Solirubrobacteraceae bacterium]|nr:hypothetical protein [Solirubrobacteraceae bacterium]
MRSKPTLRRRVLLPLAILAALGCPAAAAADSIALSIAPAPVKSVASEVNWSASSEEGRFEVVYVNNPGVPCAANPEADNGTRISEQHGLEAGSTGVYGGSVNFTPASTGEYELCAWLVIPAGLFDLEGGPVTASASLPIDVRAPAIHLALSLPRPPVPRRPFTIDLAASSEALREFVVEAVPDTARGCPVNWAAESLAPRLIDQEDVGGPWRYAANVEALRAGTYIFCAWADPPEDQGLYPEATAHLLVHVRTQTSRRRRRRAHR